MLLALHLSRLPAPGQLAHHRRIAASVLGDAAGRGGGQLFAFSNGDLALLFRPPDGGAALLATLGRLFDAEFSGVAASWTHWALQSGGEDAIAYIRDCITEAAVATAPTEERDSADVIAVLDDVVQSTPAAGLMHRQTAVFLYPGHAEPIIPAFREVAISTAAVTARLAAAGRFHSKAEPLDHLSLRVDRRSLALLTEDFLTFGPLFSGLGGAALHINLTVISVLSDAFANFASAAQKLISEGTKVGVELPFVDVFADPKAFVLARERLKLARMALVLDGVTHQALMVSRPAALNSDLVKLDWHPELQKSGPELAAAIHSLGKDRIVLHRADTELAITWGLTQGFVRYQGQHVDQMLAAERMRACHSSKLCRVRECMDRAAGACPKLRRNCMNLSLLDRGIHPRVRPSAPSMVH